MDNLEVRESQCKRDIEKLQQELEQIQKEKECKPKWKHGDRFINTNYCGRHSNIRVLVNIYDKWYVTSNNVDISVLNTVYASGIYEYCTNYIYERSNGRHSSDNYVYIDNIFERKS